MLYTRLCFPFIFLFTPVKYLFKFFNLSASNQAKSTYQANTSFINWFVVLSSDSIRIYVVYISN